MFQQRRFTQRTLEYFLVASVFAGRTLLGWYTGEVIYNLTFLFNFQNYVIFAASFLFGSKMNWRNFFAVHKLFFLFIMAWVFAEFLLSLWI